MNERATLLFLASSPCSTFGFFPDHLAHAALQAGGFGRSDAALEMRDVWVADLSQKGGGRRGVGLDRQCL
jgi:hypothetical protein